jgi:hypothetical protein
VLCSAVQCKMPLLAEVTEGAEARRVEEWDEVSHSYTSGHSGPSLLCSARLARAINASVGCATFEAVQRSSKADGAAAILFAISRQHGCACRTIYKRAPFIQHPTATAQLLLEALLRRVKRCSVWYRSSWESAGVCCMVTGLYGVLTALLCAGLARDATAARRDQPAPAGEHYM